MGNVNPGDHDPPSPKELNSVHGPYIAKMYQILTSIPPNELTSAHSEMYTGLKRIIKRELGSGVLEDGTCETVHERRACGIPNSQYSRNEFWVENTNVRFYSIIKPKQSDFHFSLFFSNFQTEHDKSKWKAKWIYTGQDPQHSDARITLAQGSLSCFFIIDGNTFTMEHLKKLRSEFYDTPRMRDLYLYYIHGFSKLNCYADADEFFRLYYMNLEKRLAKKKDKSLEPALRKPRKDSFPFDNIPAITSFNMGNMYDIETSTTARANPVFAADGDEETALLAARTKCEQEVRNKPQSASQVMEDYLNSRQQIMNQQPPQQPQPQQLSYQQFGTNRTNYNYGNNDQQANYQPKRIQVQNANNIPQQQNNAQFYQPPQQQPASQQPVFSPRDPQRQSILVQWSMPLHQLEYEGGDLASIGGLVGYGEQRSPRQGKYAKTNPNIAQIPNVNQQQPNYNANANPHSPNSLKNSQNRMPQGNMQSPQYSQQQPDYANTNLPPPNHNNAHLHSNQRNLVGVPQAQPGITIPNLSFSGKAMQQNPNPSNNAQMNNAPISPRTKLNLAASTPNLQTSNQQLSPRGNNPALANSGKPVLSSSTPNMATNYINRERAIANSAGTNYVPPLNLSNSQNNQFKLNILAPSQQASDETALATTSPRETPLSPRSRAKREKDKEGDRNFTILPGMKIDFSSVTNQEDAPRQDTAPMASPTASPHMHHSPALGAVKKPPRRESTSNTIMQDYIRAQNEIMAKNEQDEKDDQRAGLSPRKGLLKPQPRGNRIVVSNQSEPISEPTAPLDVSVNNANAHANYYQQQQLNNGGQYYDQNQHYDNQNYPPQNSDYYYNENQNYYNQQQQYAPTEEYNHADYYQPPPQQPASNAIPLKNVKIIRVVNSPPQNQYQGNNYF